MSAARRQPARVGDPLSPAHHPLTRARSVFVPTRRGLLALLAVLGFSGAACRGDSPAGPSSPVLKVSAISPTAGSTTGTTAVTITGVDFASGATVAIGGVAASGVTVQNG